MSSTGLLIDGAVPVVNGAKIISASRTVRCLGGRNQRYEVVMRYRSPADVRPRKPKENDLRVVNERLQEAYRLFAQRMKERGFVDLEEMDG